jgi:hypothetical protein
VLKTHLGKRGTSKKYEFVKLRFFFRKTQGRKVLKILHKNNIYEDISEGGKRKEFKKITIATL